MSDLMDTVTYMITLTSATHLVLLQQYYYYYYYYYKWYIGDLTSTFGCF
jgi:hypothetical protein